LRRPKLSTRKFSAWQKKKKKKKKKKIDQFSGYVEANVEGFGFRTTRELKPTV
jgi:hypothetical protein